jgi:WXG100 family type VII secretion target
MAEKIKMNFGMMEEMAQAFSDGAQVLESTVTEVNNIAAMLENDGLIGQAGEALSDACRTQLAGSITRLKDKFEELQKDINSAMDEMRSADSSARGRYN